MFLGFGIGKILKAAKSVTGIAKKLTGKTGGFTSILKANPSLMSIALPPQVQAGLAVAKTVGSYLDIEVPSQAEIEGTVSSKLDTALEGIQSDVVARLDKVIDVGAAGVTLEKIGDTIESVTETTETVSETLNKIQWLL